MRNETGRDADRSFILQQGVRLPGLGARPALMSALMFQPRVVGLWFLLGWALQSGYAILALSAALWWGALVPARNPFDLIHDRLPAGRTTRARLDPAPAPRRFAQGLAGMLSAAAGALLLGGATRIAFAIAVIFCLAVGLLTLGRFCLGSFVYHLLHGRAAFAIRTLPWRAGRGVADGCEVSASRA